MKAILFTWTIAVIHLSAFSQALPNPSFEDWDTEQLWEDPIPFQSTNLQSYFGTALPNVVKDATNPHGGSFAAMITSSSDDVNTMGGALFIGTPGDMGIAGGVPFTSMPDSLRFFARNYNSANDSAFVAAFIKTGGNTVAIAVAQMTGTNNTYQEYVVPVMWFADTTPDTLGFIATNTNFESPSLVSWLEIDDISFIYNNGIGEQIPGGDFETWNPFAVTEPVDWNTSNAFTYAGGESVTETDDAHSGNSAARIESQQVVFDDEQYLGFIINGTIGEDVIDGGLELDGQIPQHFGGWYKYDAATPDDSAGVYFLLRYWDEAEELYDTLVEIELLLPATGVYTPFEINIPADDIEDWIDIDLYPDLLTLGFTSTKVDEEGWIAPQGSVMLVDDLELDYYVGIGENEKFELNVFPNPASNELHITHLSSNESELIEIIDAQGKNVMRIMNHNPQNEIVLDIHQLTAGAYTLMVTTGTTKKISAFEIVR